MSNGVGLLLAVLLLLASSAQAESSQSRRPNAVRAYEDEQQLLLLRERIARRAFLDSTGVKDVDGGTTEDDDDEAPDSEDTEKLRAEVAALKKELIRKKGEKEEAPEEPEEAEEEKAEAVEDHFKEAFAAKEKKKTKPKTTMPYFGGQTASLTPFGREDVAQELTERSIMESDRMVDQIEKAEVAEEKRAVYRALTRLRGAAINSFDGVAHSQVGNIDEYAATNQFREQHPVKHLAHEESNVKAWAFPDPAAPAESALFSGPGPDADVDFLLELPDDE